MGDTVPDINADAKSESDSNLEETGEVGQQEVGELACPKCEQIYAGPASLKRHLWRIHRLAGDDAQALVDEATDTPVATEQTEEKEAPEEEQEEDEENASGDVKPLLAVSLSTTTTPKVRPLLSLSPEPPIFQGGYCGGMSPGTAWSMPNQGSGGGGAGGATVPQTGLLPTPPAGPGMGSACHQTSSPEAPANPSDESQEPASTNKVPPLMSLGITPSPDQGGIKPLMSIPVDYPPYMMSGSMGYGFHGGRFRRRERRPRPYHHKDSSRDENQDLQQEYEFNSENGNQGEMESSATGEEMYLEGQEQEEDQSESYDTICGECGLRFDDPASLADHEPCSQSVSIDLNCDVEITG